MKHRKRIKFRIWVWCSIALFLLIPFLSPQVAAGFTAPLGTGVWTNNWPPPPGLGPTAGGTIRAPTWTGPDSPPCNISFLINYTYTDSYPGGSGSNHWMSVTGSYQPGGIGAWIPFTFTQSVVSLGPTGTATGTYIIPWITGYGGPGTNFNLNVIVNCQDVSTTTTFTWTSGAVTFTTS